MKKKVWLFTLIVIMLPATLSACGGEKKEETTLVDALAEEAPV